MKVVAAIVGLLVVTWASVEAAEDVCKLPKVVGRCRAAMPRFWFNAGTGKCEKFTYGGCGGNGNNFNTLEKCQATCRPEPEISVCEPPPMLPPPEISVCEPPPMLPPLCEEKKDVGPCRAAMPRFWFNAGTGKCEKFTYGGCGGNGNNFKTLDACTAKCSPKKPVNAEISVCEPPPMLPPQEAVNVCEEKKDVGPCRAAMPRFWFNAASGKCEKFTYGGCGGNGNNFNTLDACTAKCSPKKPVNVCDEPKVVGPCRAAFPRFFFNADTGKCESFIYGGCHGNGNNFVSKKDCSKRCEPQISVCEPPPQTIEMVGKPLMIEPKLEMVGKPLMIEPKPQISVCEPPPQTIEMVGKPLMIEPKPQISVCEPPPQTMEMVGTPLVFERKPEISVCEPPHTIEMVGKPLVIDVPARCLEPKSYGEYTKKNRRYNRYRYSPRTNKCYRFPYKGKGGNGNRFRTRKACLKTCQH